MKRFINSLGQLRGKLTLSYTLTTAVAFLLVEVLIIGSALTILTTHIPAFILNDLNQKASQAAPYLVNAAHDPEAIAIWLQITSDAETKQEPLHNHPIFLMVTDLQGQIIASVGSHPVTPGTSLANQLTAHNRGQLRHVLNDTRGTTSFADNDSGDTLVAIAPIMGANGRIQGALVLKIIQPDVQFLFSGFFRLILFSVVLVTILTTLIGTVFGYLIARGLTRRFKTLSAAADRWSRGDFSAHAQDTSHDELGQMARQLNSMAEELQNLLAARQQLATLEERNRLARDLHDSVKQQVFAVSMQIGATKLLLRRDIDAAEERLNRAEKLVQQAQQELTSLIRELRPVALEGQGLVAALRELIPQWSQQTEIVANLRVEGSQTLPLTVEEALFRVAQEALSNVARHSQATLVQLTLTLSDETVTLIILDNGQGFDPAQRERRGIGLHSMQERMKTLGGDAQLESTPGKGTRVVAFCHRLGVTSETDLEGTPDAPLPQRIAPKQ